MLAVCVLSLYFISFENVGASLLEPVIENVVHLQTALPPPDTPGIWKKKMIWKARWVQEWKSAKTYRSVWRKVWSPVEIREWVPIPRPPPEDLKPDDHPPHDIESYPPLSSGPPEPTVGPVGPPGNPPPFRPMPPNKYGPPSNAPPNNSRPPNGGPSNKYGPPNNAPPNNFRPPNNGPPSNGPSNNFGSPSDGPPNRYGPPSGSTALRPVAGNSPLSWPAQDMNTLLSSYRTIKDNDDLTSDDETGPINYHANPSDRQNPSNFFEPPKSPASQVRYRDTSNNLQDLTANNNSVSPYAAKLAEAVIREKLKQGATERPPGLTDIIYRTDQGVTASPRPAKSTEVTDNPSNVYIVTPVSFG